MILIPDDTPTSKKGPSGELMVSECVQCSSHPNDTPTTSRALACMPCRFAICAPEVRLVTWGLKLLESVTDVLLGHCHCRSMYRLLASLQEY